MLLTGHWCAARRSKTDSSRSWTLNLTLTFTTTTTTPTNIRYDAVVVENAVDQQQKEDDHARGDEDEVPLAAALIFYVSKRFIFSASWKRAVFNRRRRFSPLLKLINLQKCTKTVFLEREEKKSYLPSSAQ